MGTRVKERTILNIRAWRLAAADFYYALDPKVTAHLLQISDIDAAKARKSPTYFEHIERLKLEMDQTLRNGFSKDADRLRMSLSSMVPKALEVLARNLESTDDSVSLRAAQEVLDRDGRMPKVSRVQNVAEEMAKLPEVDQSIIDEFHKPTVN